MWAKPCGQNRVGKIVRGKPLLFFNLTLGNCAIKKELLSLQKILEKKYIFLIPCNNFTIVGIFCTHSAANRLLLGCLYILKDIVHKNLRLQSSNKNV